MMLNLSYRTTPSSLSRQGWWHNEPSGNTCALQQKGMVIPQLIGGNLPTTSLMTVRWLHNTQYIMSWHVLTVAHIKSLDLDFSGRTTVTTSLFTSKITGIPSDSLSDSLSDSKAHGAMSGQVCHSVGGSTHQKRQDLHVVHQIWVRQNAVSAHCFLFTGCNMQQVQS